MPGKAAAPRECLKVDRIDHGVRAAEDPALLERLAVQRVPLNVCLSSNLSLLYRDPREHPLRQLLDVGAAVTLSRDDPMFLGALTLNGGAAAGGGVCPVSEAELLRCQETAVDAAFCSEETKTPFGRRWRRSGAKAEDPQVPTPLPPHRMKRIPQAADRPGDTISRKRGNRFAYQ